MPRVRVSRAVSKASAPVYVAGRGFASTGGKTTAGRITRKSRRGNVRKRVTDLERRIIQDKQYSDFSFTGAAIGNTWTISYISGLAQGDDIGTRDGREIHVNGIQLQGGIATAAASTGPMRCRVVLLCDNECDGAAPGATDIFIANLVDSLYNYTTTNMGRFTILYDKYFNIGPIGSSNNCVNIRFNKKMKKKLEFGGTTSAIASAGRGAIFGMYCADSVAGGNPVFNANFRMWFDG